MILDSQRRDNCHVQNFGNLHSGSFAISKVPDGRVTNIFSEAFAQPLGIDDMSGYSTNGYFYFVLAYVAHSYWMKVKKPSLLFSARNKRLKKMLELCPTLTNNYWPSLVFLNAHMQLFPFIFRGIVNKLVSPPYTLLSEVIKTDDGETLVLDWFVPRRCDTSNQFFADSSHSGCVILRESMESRSIVMLQHGAMCDSADMPGQDYIQPAHDRGWLVCCLNRRGHSQPLTRPRWNFFGSTSDVRLVTRKILSRIPQAKLFTIGISSGSGLVARHFGEDGNDFYAGVGICPGYDIETCMSRFSFPYQVQ